MDSAREPHGLTNADLLTAKDGKSAIGVVVMKAKVVKLWR